MGWFNDNMDSDGSEFGFTNNLPDHIDPLTGQYKTGVRKCSHCKAFKTKGDYTKEEAQKPAARRLCHGCLAAGAAGKKKATKPAKKAAGAPAPLPDVASMKIKEMKEELESYGVSTAASW